MAYSLNFDKRLKQKLESLRLGYDWKLGREIDSKSIVDVTGCKDGIPRVFIEVELKKDNPVENVVKVWRWAHRTKNVTPVLFLHAFSGHYRTDSRSDIRKPKQPRKAKQYDRAVFVGEQMKKDRRSHIDYRPLLIHTTTRAGGLIQYKPRIRPGSVTKAGGGAMHRAADTLGSVIGDMLKSKPIRAAIRIHSARRLTQSTST